MIYCNAFLCLRNTCLLCVLIYVKLPRPVAVILYCGLAEL